MISKPGGTKGVGSRAKVAIAGCNEGADGGVGSAVDNGGAKLGGGGEVGGGGVEGNIFVVGNGSFLEKKFLSKEVSGRKVERDEVIVPSLEWESSTSEKSVLVMPTPTR